MVIKEEDFSNDEDEKSVLGELREDVSDGLNKGYHLGEIRKFLLKQGVDEKLVERAMQGFSGLAGWDKWLGTFFILTSIFLIFTIAGSLSWYVIDGDLRNLGILGNNSLGNDGGSVVENLLDVGGGGEEGVVDAGAEIFVGNFTNLNSSYVFSKNFSEELVLAVEEKNLTRCDYGGFGAHQNALCRIAVQSKLGNSDFCNELKNEEQLFYTFKSDSGDFSVSSIDSCFMTMALQNDLKYCEEIQDLNIKEICLKGGANA